MSRTDTLLDAYRRHISLPWPRSAPGAARVVMVVYPPNAEREMRARMPEFRLVTEQASHHWSSVDLTNAFESWIASHPYREMYFDEPQLLDNASLDRFFDHVVTLVVEALHASATEPEPVVAITGCGAMYGFAQISRLLRRIDGDVPGRVAVFFPGEKEGNNYRLLGARDGWNYMAVAITA